MLLLAGVVLCGLLGGETGARAGSVEVAAVVHGLLKRVTFPAEDVVTVGGRATKESRLACVFVFESREGSVVAYPMFME